MTTVYVQYSVGQNLEIEEGIIFMESLIVQIIIILFRHIFVFGHVTNYCWMAEQNLTWYRCTVSPQNRQIQVSS